MVFQIYRFLDKILGGAYRRINCVIRSKYYSTFIDEGEGRILVKSPSLKIKIIKERNSKFIVDGIFKISSYNGGRSPVNIVIGENANFHIKGNFEIGNGVKISLNKGSVLTIGGQNTESGSGITCDSMVFVNKFIDIGYDFICAWNVFISDSDWHQVNNQILQADVKIGNHVWVANNSNILKGSDIGNNCIVASLSKIVNKKFPSNSLIAGSPSRIVKSDVCWSR